jgi:chromosome partitioning protein
MIITVANEKGGQEKSLLAKNLAALRAMAGHKVLLVDGDPRQYSLAWCNHRTAATIAPKIDARAICGKGMHPELENLCLRYNDIVIDSEDRDCLGSRSALIAARIAIIPIHPENMDASSQEKLIHRIDTARLFNPVLQVIFVIVDVMDDPSILSLNTIRSFVSRIPAATLASTILHEPNALHDALEKGLSYCECIPFDARAIAEMRNLYDEVFKI